MAKILNRVLGATGVAILVSSLGVLAACGEPADENASAKETVSNANVALTIYDENGIAVGEGTGILIAEKTVLTAAHLVAGKGKWTVTSADGKTKVNGIRGQTFDWRKYDSNMAHPRKHDVAVIFLDRPIHLASYPKIATAAQQNGEQVMRVSHAGGAFQFIDSKLDRVRQMPNAYVTSMPSSETLDTGGAVVNTKGEIVGVVTGRGMQTGKLYIAKLGETLDWLSAKATCGGAAKGGALSLRTIGTPPPKDGCTKDGGAAGSTSSSGGSSSGTGSSSGGSSSGGSSSGGSSSGASGSSSGGGGAGSNDSDSGKCEVGGGFYYPGGAGGPGAESTTGLNGSSENGSLGGPGGGGGTGFGDGSGTGGGTGTGTNGSSTNGSTGTNTGGTGSGTGTGTGTGTGSGTGTGTNGGTTNGSTGSTTGGAGSGTDGSNTGSTAGVIPGGSGGAGGSAGLDEEVCEGENDNPEVCPPETILCEGALCGGAMSPGDNTIDYGASSNDNGGTPGEGSIILR